MKVCVGIIKDSSPTWIGDCFDFDLVSSRIRLPAVHVDGSSVLSPCRPYASVARLGIFSLSVKKLFDRGFSAVRECLTRYWLHGADNGKSPHEREWD